MNESSNVPAFRSIQAVAELNKTKAFDPTRFIRIAQGGGLMLELKYKKMWFRVIYPEGKVRTVLLQKPDQVAIIETKVYRNVADTDPMASYISTRYANGPDGPHYVQAAQYEAEDQALSAAGFGIQFADVTVDTEIERLVATGAIPMGANVPSPTIQPAAVVQQPASAQPALVAQQPIVVQPAPTMQQPAATAPPVAEPLMVAEQPIAAAPPVAEPPMVAEQPIAVASPAAEPPMVAEQPIAAAPPVAEPLMVAEQPIAAAPPVAEPPMVAEQPVAAVLPVAEPPMVAVQPVAAEQPVVAVPPMAEPIVFPAVSVGENPAAAKYTKDMAVEEICRTMTREEALAIPVRVGAVKDKNWTLAQVEKERPASLKWYLNGYPGDDNILRAGAYILLHGEQAQAVAV